MKIYILCGDLERDRYVRKDYEFSHSLSSGERTGNSPNRLNFFNGVARV